MFHRFLSRQSGIGLVLGTCIYLSTASAMFAPPQTVPVDRLVNNAEAYITKHSQDAEAHYVLARIHYLAFHLTSSKVLAYPRAESDGLPSPVADWMLGWSLKPADKVPLESAELASHAVLAIREFHEALRLAPKNGLYHLGLASLCNEVLTWKESKQPKNPPPELERLTLADARAEYAAAFKDAFEEDSKLKALPVEGLAGIVSYEAASALVRVSEHIEGTLTAEEKKDLADARKAVEKLGKLHMGAITPIVFSWERVSHLDELLLPDRTVDFDLRGYGMPERWPWVKPELGFIVWDPMKMGEIRSARQMFGSYSFEIFRRDGYEALQALDDNGDGVLSGAELDGLSVWFDRNSDGFCTPDEVTPLRDLGIISVAVEASGHDGRYLVNVKGITLRDGRTFPTWDWVTEPALPKSETVTVRR